MASRPPASPAECDPRVGELLPVEARALEEVGELLAVRDVVERELLVPRAGLDLGCEHHSAGGRYSTASSAFGGHEEARAGCSCSSARCARRLAVRARIGTARTMVGGKAEIEHDGGDRHRDVERQRLAPRVRYRIAQRARERDVRAAHAALVRELEDPLRSRIDGLVHGMPEARHLAAGRMDLAGCGGRDLRRLAPRRRPLAAGPRAAARTRQTFRGRRFRRRGSRRRPRPAASPALRRASSAPRRSSASSRARRARRGRGRGRSAARRSAPLPSGAGGSTP